MKVLVLHGTSGNSGGEWFPWLKSQLEEKGHQVWVPDLPGADEPDVNAYNPYILKNCPFEIDKNTVIIGHSSGATAALGLVQILPSKIFKVISVAGGINDLDFDPVKKMFATWKFDWKKIRSMSSEILCIYSDDDPYIPVGHAQQLHKLVGAKLMLIPGQKHFNVSSFSKYSKFPELLDLI